jgi:hypothetical protein
MGTTWSPSTDLFPTSPISRERNAAHLPFQAYACWNGIAVFQSSTFLGSPASAPSAKSEPPIHFRRSDAAAGECAQAEVSLLCKDLWRQKAFGPEARAAKLLVVPGVRVAYERHVAEGVRALDKATVGGLIEPDVGRSGWSGRRDREQVSWVNKYVVVDRPTGCPFGGRADLLICLVALGRQQRCAVTRGRKRTASGASTSGSRSHGSTRSMDEMYHVRTPTSVFRWTNTSD